MKKAAAVVVGMLLFAGCVSSGGEDDESGPIAKSKPATKSEPKNPLDKSENRTACGASRREVGKYGDVFTALGNGTALSEDAVKAAGKLQQEIGDAGSYATGSIRTNLLALSDAYGRMRVTLTTGDLDGLAAAVGEQNAALTSLDRDCSSIGA